MRFKASRDVPLLYPLTDHAPHTPFARPHSEPSSPGSISPTQPYSSSSRRAEEGEPAIPGESMLRRRLTRVIAGAYTQDFEKKRKPRASDSENLTNMKRDGVIDEDDEELAGKNSSDEDEDEEDIGDEADAMSIDELTRRGEGRSQSDED
ncbi:hypothetical protein B7463_g9783, partial [Scytalidium lignicola]